jgi:hypothetical protein
LATRSGHTIWDNGLGQNVFFLVKLLRALPAVRDVVLLNCGAEPRMPADAEALMPDLKLLRPNEATELVDVVIEMSGGLDVEWLDYLRARGKKVVYLCCGQPYVGRIDATRSGYCRKTAYSDRCLKPCTGARSTKSPSCGIRCSSIAARMN